MRRIVIFGNSGAGKSTLAKGLVEADNGAEGLEHLDLDTLAWQATIPPERKLIVDSKRQIDEFISHNDNWVIEGCYGDLLELALVASTELIFLNISNRDCIDNAKSRPWESHKYESKKAQDANLEMLIDWIQQYSQRTDTFSQASHMGIYEKYTKQKIMVTNLYEVARMTMTREELECCRVCGFRYEGDPPWGYDNRSSTFIFCSCCNVEFGYSDCTLKGIRRYRDKWLENGGQWSDLKHNPPPAGWSVEGQLKNIPRIYK